jgi:hypothetical protein
LEYLLKLLDKNLRITMGKNGFEFLKEEYNVQNSYKKIIEKIS